MTNALINTEPIANAMLTIADKLGYTVQQIYQIYVAAQFKIAMINAILATASILTMLILIVYLWWYHKKLKDANDYDAEEKIFYRAFFGGIIVAIIIGFLCVLQGILIQLYCPEYCAIQQMLSQFGNLL
jgi:hypothetical protein